MITDEQIMQIAKNYIRHVGSHYINELAIPDNGMIEGFARELIALAQQVKPLQFIKQEFRVPVGPNAHLVADCITGKYLIHMAAYPVIAKMKYFFSGPEFGTHTSYLEREKFDTEAEAIEAASADYRKQVLSCLVHGGV